MANLWDGLQLEDLGRDELCLIQQIRALLIIAMPPKIVQVIL